MSYKRTVRTIGKVVRAADRSAKRRQRELDRQQKQYEKMAELEQAEYEVEVYENHIDLLQSVHKECSERIDWNTLASQIEPLKPENSRQLENKARSALSSYSPGFFDKIFKNVETKKERFEKDILYAIERDDKILQEDIENWKKEHIDWSEQTQLAKGVLNGNAQAKIQAIKELEPFSELSTLGSSLNFSVHKSGYLDVIINIHGDEVVPTEVKSLLKSGRLSIKKMPKGRFNEIYQDYVCSCILRIANEIFSVLPDDKVFATAVDDMLNKKTGHQEESPILSICVSRSTLESLNMDNIDPSDSMENFVHNMSFKKTTGFGVIEKIDMDSFESA